MRYCKIEVRERCLTVLGSRLTNLRNQRKKTQEDIAEILGITRPAYTAYEKETRKPDYGILMKLADYYDVTVDYLLGRTEFPEYNEKQQQEFNQFSKDPELQRFFYELPESDEEDVKALQEIWEVIKKRKN